MSGELNCTELMQNFEILNFEREDLVSLRTLPALLQALPILSRELYIDDETIRIVLALRLGLPICEAHSYKLCGRSLDRLGHHGLSCTKSAGRSHVTQPSMT